MKRRISIHGLVLSVGMGAGCGAVTPSMTPSTTDVTGEQLTVTIEEDLARLRQLQIVEVRQLKLSLPAEATACYGLPCPGTEWQAQYDAERARQAPPPRQAGHHRGSGDQGSVPPAAHGRRGGGGSEGAR